MSWRSSNRLPSEPRFSFDQITPHPQRKHYWGLPNKNYGFLTSDQLDDLKQRVRTQPDQVVYFREKSKRREEKRDEVIYEEDSNCLVHCCTCHNNPHRYLQNSQRCKFCRQYKKIPKTRSELSRFSMAADTIIYNNPQQYSSHNTPNYQAISDKAIQVDIKLPKIRHNHRNSEHCQACRQRKKCQQHQEVASELVVCDRLKRARVKGFSFGSSPKAVNYLTPKVKDSKRNRYDF